MTYAPSRITSDILLWMTGQSHEKPRVWALSYHERWYVLDRRRQNFFNACRTACLDLALWPEFEEQLVRLKLKSGHERGTFSMGVAGLLIAQRNRSVGSWLARSARLERQGKNPLKRRRYVKAMRQFYVAVAQARALAERRHFEQVARRMFDTAEGN